MSLIDINWLVNYEEDYVDPQDGGELLYYWWEDMRPREVRELVMSAYERGLKFGLEQDSEELSHNEQY